MSTVAPAAPQPIPDWYGRAWQVQVNRSNGQPLEDQTGSVSVTVERGKNALYAVNRICERAQLRIDMLETAGIFKGMASYLLAQLAADVGMHYFLTPIDVQMFSFTRSVDASQINLYYGPTYPDAHPVRPTLSDPPYTPTLIGTPELTEQGANFRVLLDSQVQIKNVVKLDLPYKQRPAIAPGLIERMIPPMQTRPLAAAESQEEVSGVL